MADTLGEEKQEKPETRAVKPTIQPWHLLVMNALDCTYLLDSSAKTNYKNGHYLVMNSHDAGHKIT